MYVYTCSMDMPVKPATVTCTVEKCVCTNCWM